MLPRFRRPVRLEVLGLPELEPMIPLLQLERAEFGAVLGQPLQLSEPTEEAHHSWQLRIDPGVQEPQLEARPEAPGLISTVSRAEDFGQTLQLLHSLARSPGTALAYAELASYEQVLDRIAEEVLHTYPSWQLRSLDPQGFLSHRPERPESRPWTSEEFWPAVQRWVAQLGDAHTAVIASGTRHRPPYRAVMTSAGAQLLEVPEGTAAHRAGVRVGWTVDCPDPAHLLSTVGASPQHRAQVAARRFLEMTTPQRSFTARSPEGAQVTWTERPQSPGPSVSSEDSAAGETPVVRVHRFDGETPELFRAAVQAYLGEPELTVDLRGNAGGSLVAADQCRRMLLPRSGEYGGLRHSDGRAGLSALHPLRLESADIGFRGRLRLLVDEMTYSAAEDFLQPLVGMRGVRIEGGPTGGGSGRPRTIPLMEGWTLSLSTAITYTAAGDPIEFHGISGD